ncbi:DUF2799 domain-containing protein [Vibrio makurazakiensis]|uniref:DUF2799 domain-containing protein n=1 Tax=Vibrio makurazakiensis TaxID=2910250 RepID=UPI003D0CEC5D
MRYLWLLATLLFLGCAQTQLPVSSTTDTWQEYGIERALNGSLKLSEASMAKANDGKPVSLDLYAAYEQGYEIGRTEYCSQDAYILGVKGKQYLGICDKIDYWFRDDYNAGRQSMSGGI